MCLFHAQRLPADLHGDLLKALGFGQKGGNPNRESLEGDDQDGGGLDSHV